jgi:hypothetical protein
VTAVAIRRLLVALGVAGIAGMIATSVADSAGGALAFGLLTGAAAVTHLALTAAQRDGAVADDEVLARTIEQRVGDLVAGGAEERRVRALVEDAVRLGRSRTPSA